MVNNTVTGSVNASGGAILSAMRHTIRIGRYGLCLRFQNTISAIRFLLRHQHTPPLSHYASSATFEDNKVIGGGSGGAVASNGGSLQFGQNLAMRRNEAGQGGAAVHRSGNIRYDPYALFEANGATSGNGGALAVDNLAQADFYPFAILRENTAAVNGAAITMANSAIVIFLKCVWLFTLRVMLFP